jgi:TPR repeat protein
MRARPLLGLILLASACAPAAGPGVPMVVVCPPGQECRAQPANLNTAELRGDPAPGVGAPVRRGGRMVDPVASARAAEAAAEGGVVQAQHDFALMLFRGEGVSRDPYRALQYMRRAARGGHVPDPARAGG